MTGIMCALAGSGAANPITLADDTIMSIGSVAQTATLTVANDGKVKATITGSATYDIQSWLRSWAVVSDYEVNATIMSGPLSSGTTSTWLGLGTSRSWSVSDPANDGVSFEAVLSVSIRKIGTTHNLDTATFTLTAERI